MRRLSNESWETAEKKFKSGEKGENRNKTTETEENESVLNGWDDICPRWTFVQNKTKQNKTKQNKTKQNKTTNISKMEGKKKK